jgi:hypothetical protein
MRPGIKPGSPAYMADALQNKVGMTVFLRHTETAVISTPIEEPYGSELFPCLGQDPFFLWGPWTKQAFSLIINYLLCIALFKIKIHHRIFTKFFKQISIKFYFDFKCITNYYAYYIHHFVIDKLWKNTKHLYLFIFSETVSM